MLRASFYFDIQRLEWGEYEQIDKTTLKRLKDIERLDPGTKTKVFDIKDTYLRDFKTRQAYGA